MSTTTTLGAVEVIKERIDLLFITSAGVVIPSNLIANYGKKKTFGIQHQLRHILNNCVLVT